MLSLAWRNVWRRPGRSLMTVGAMALVVWLLILMNGMAGAARNGIYQSLTNQLGVLQVYTKNHAAATSFAGGLIEHAGAAQAKLKPLVGQKAVVGVLEAPTLVTRGQHAQGAMLIGEDLPPNLLKSFAAQYLSSGSMPIPGLVAGIALGGALAARLKVHLGDTITLFSPGSPGRGVGIFKVEGILDFPDPQMNAGLAYTSLAPAQALAAPDALTRIELRPSGFTLATEGGLTKLRSEIAKALGGSLEVQTWREANPIADGMLRLLTPMFGIYGVLFFVLAGLLVMNTMYLSLMERVREFGLLQALGTSSGRLRGLVFLESLMLSIGGALLGTALGLITVAWLGRGIYLPHWLANVYTQFGLPTTLYPVASVGGVLFAAALAVLTGLIAAQRPARQAASISPVEAMHIDT